MLESLCRAETRQNDIMEKQIFKTQGYILLVKSGLLWLKLINMLGWIS